jgi:hypothetical protein
MTFYFVMINAWSLAWEALYGDMDKEYPIKNESYDDFENPLPPQDVDMSVGAGNTALDNDGLDYEVDLFDGASADYLADIDDQRAHHFSTWDDGMSLQVTEEKPMTAHYFKYHEQEILKDIEEYVSRTYQGHYTGNSYEFRNVQTLDLMAAKELASGFCQANILKYGSRYGNKDGRNTKDLMKVIHYAMLLLHFDGHYGEPSMSKGNIDQIDHNMP